MQLDINRSPTLVAAFGHCASSSSSPAQARGTPPQVPRTLRPALPIREFARAEALPTLTDPLPAQPESEWKI